MAGFRALGGWLAGCMVATAVIVVSPIVGAAASSGLDSDSFMAGGLLILVMGPILVFPFVFVMSAIPALIAIWLAELLRTHSIVYFACAGAATGALCISALPLSDRVWASGVGWIYVVARVAAGATYWCVAGRYLNRDTRRSEEPCSCFPTAWVARSRRSR
ncbi:hypothetical protein H8A99_39540 [Bradyrhizobium sp. Arg68]|uniref:hypothetical protein n=1 Tax=Bradyrhizobium ivorense TaxID=2511166 RepID=UPI001E305781|nr:hypothetical protein [Bradyrhizobium ivorense]MCC8942343.1 hypothetical protein [Bradyrhizobium ivorense]